MKRGYVSFRGQHHWLPTYVLNERHFENNSMDELKIKNFRKWIFKKLDNFVSSEDSELILEPMSSEERRIAHIAARKLDLRSISKGKEPERYMTIKKNRIRGGMFSCLSSMNETQTITLEKEQKTNIQNFISEFPIEHQHIEDHFALPDNKKKNRKNCDSNVSKPQKLIPPASYMSSEIEQFRVLLPTFCLREKILQIIDSYKVTLITGGTGCGKTTQIPQFILEEARKKGKPIRIMCTQPRRLPAIAVSKRVAIERGERLGHTVGYHIRLEQKTSPETILTYCTSGVLLRMLTVDELASDMTHIILDEIHEREQNTDYLLIALKQALKRRNDLKIILMSATMEGNLDTFINYFDSTAVGYIDIPSRLYNVEKFDLADVLALTGYMPCSSFGGLFNTNCVKESNQQSYNFDSFPPIGEFRSEDQNFGSMSQQYNDWRLPQYLPQNSYYSNQQIKLPLVKNDSNLLNCYPNNFLHDNFYYKNRDVNNYYGPKSPDIYRNCSNGYENTSFGFDKSIVNNVFFHLEKVLPNRPSYFDPKIVSRLKKCDMNKNALISSYLNSGGQQWADSVDVDLTVQLIKYLFNCPIEGSILVFLPGYDDIIQITDRLFSIMSEFKYRLIFFTLHSQINSHEQQRVFEKVSHDCRKVILSTNIAEASLTINDVVFVIDCGKVKEKTYDHTTRITQLKIAWIAKSNAEQRAGRAGRCRNGYCFRLYSKRDYDNMFETQVPEMKRSAIHDVCLHAKMFAPENMSVKKFLEMAPEPPPPLAIDHSIEFLEQLGALYSDKEKQQSLLNADFHENTIPPAATFFEDSSSYFCLSKNAVNINTFEPELTELGRVLAHLPLEPQLARLLLFGLALKCFDPIVTLVASLSHRDPFLLPMGDDRMAALNARDEFARRDFSDHLMLIRAFYAFCTNNYRQHQFCSENFLSLQTMKMIQGIRHQLFLELKRLHFLPINIVNYDDPNINLYSNCWPMIQGAIVAGCYPGLGFVKAGSKLRKIRTNANVSASLHPSSVIKRQIFNTSKRSEFANRFGCDYYWDPTIEYLAYQELSKIEEGLTLRMVTIVPPLTVLLFAGPLRTSKEIIENFEIAEEDISLEELKKDVQKKHAKVSNNQPSKCYKNLDKDENQFTTEVKQNNLAQVEMDSEKLKIEKNLNISALPENSKWIELSDQLQKTDGQNVCIDNIWKNIEIQAAKEFEKQKLGAKKADNLALESLGIEDVFEKGETLLLNKLNNWQFKTEKELYNNLKSQKLKKLSDKTTNQASTLSDLKTSKEDLKENFSEQKTLTRNFENVIDQINSQQIINENLKKNKILNNSSAEKNEQSCSNNVVQQLFILSPNNSSEQISSANNIDNNTNLEKNKKKEKNVIENDCDVDDAEHERLRIEEYIEYEQEYVMELEKWLAFKGSFDTMQALARLRFKLMYYFLSSLKNPTRRSTAEDLKLLECLSKVLCADHKRNRFPSCNDLPKPRQKNLHNKDEDSVENKKRTTKDIFTNCEKFDYDYQKISQKVELLNQKTNNQINTCSGSEESVYYETHDKPLEEMETQLHQEKNVMPQNKTKNAEFFKEHLQLLNEKKHQTCGGNAQVLSDFEQKRIQQRRKQNNGYLNIKNGNYHESYFFAKNRANDSNFNENVVNYHENDNNIAQQNCMRHLNQKNLHYKRNNNYYTEDEKGRQSTSYPVKHFHEQRSNRQSNNGICNQQRFTYDNKRFDKNGKESDYFNGNICQYSNTNRSNNFNKLLNFHGNKNNTSFDSVPQMNCQNDFLKNHGNIFDNRNSHEQYHSYPNNHQKFQQNSRRTNTKEFYNKNFHRN